MINVQNSPGTNVVVGNNNHTLQTADKMSLRMDNYLDHFKSRKGEPISGMQEIIDVPIPDHMVQLGGSPEEWNEVFRKDLAAKIGAIDIHSCVKEGMNTRIGGTLYTVNHVFEDGLVILIPKGKPLEKLTLHPDVIKELLAQNLDFWED